MKGNLKTFIKLCYYTLPSYFGLGYFLAVVSGIMAPVLVSVYSKYIDMAISSISNTDIISTLIYSFIVLILLKAFEQFSWVIIYGVKNKFSLLFREKLLQRVIDKVIKLEYKNMENSEVLALMHRVNLRIEIVDINISYTMDIIRNLVGIIGIIFVLANLGVLNILLLIGILALVIVLSYICSNNQYRYIFDYSETDRKVDYIEMLLKSKEIVPETKIFNSLGFLKSIYVKNMDKSTEIFHNQLKVTKPIEEIIIPLLGDSFLIAIYLLFLIPLKNGQYTIGFYLAIINASIAIIHFIVAEMPVKLKSLFIFKKYINDFCSLTNMAEINIEEHRYDLKDIKSIKFDNVYYKYRNCKDYVLNGLSFELKKGNHYALIGENGAGKTTIIKLLTGLYKATKGEITINGININNYSAADLSDVFSVVFQNFSKYNVSLKEFITLDSLKEFNQEKADEIAKNLQLTHIINNMEHKYDTVLGKEWQDGVDVSGGQWQKLVLFRFLYKNLPIQILDEPTAALDPASESKLYQLYENNSKKDIITLFISHRLASTKFADDILLIKDGKVKENGTHTQLMSYKGDYYNMFQAQKQWYLRDEIDY